MSNATPDLPRLSQAELAPVEVYERSHEDRPDEMKFHHRDEVLERLALVRRERRST